MHRFLLIAFAFWLGLQPLRVAACPDCTEAAVVGAPGEDVPCDCACASGCACATRIAHAPETVRIAGDSILSAAVDLRAVVPESNILELHPRPPKA